MKHKLSLFAVLLMALAIPQSVKAYDFSKAYQGQMLYYTVIDSVNHYVMLTCPKDSIIVNNWVDGWWNRNSSLWDSDIQPSGTLLLPDTVSHDGIIYIVRAIGAFAFSRCPISSVVMSNTIDSIGAWALGLCPNLFDVSFSNSLRYIGTEAFRGTNLGDVVLPSSVRVLGEASMSNAHITRITLNDSLEVIGLHSLTSNLFSSLYIPASVRSISSPCWYMGSTLTSIVVDTNNPYYDSRDNCNAIISTANGSVIQVCNNTVLPEGITTLYGDAFRGYSFNTLVVPSTVTRIGIHEGQINKLVISSPHLESLNLWNGVGTIRVLLDTPPILPQNYGVLTNPIQVPCNALSTYLADAIWGTFPNYLDVLEYNINANGNEHGTVVIEGPTCTNPNATLTAIPDTGYIFTQWSDGDTNNPRTVTVTQDTTFTAIWQVKPFEGIFSQEYQGQMLYYRVIDQVNHYVMLTCPKDSLITNINFYDTWIDGWDYSNRPTGALVLPDTVTHNEITYTVRAIGACAFSNCPIFTVSMPNTVDSLGDAAFGGCSYLSEITFSDSLRYIGKYAFSRTNLGSVVLPSQVSILKEFAFHSAHITNITLNNSLQKLERGCLADNIFTSLYIPASVSDVALNFMNDDWTGMGDRLSSIVVDSSNPYYDSRSNCNAIINSATNQLLVGCKNTIIPESVHEIHFQAFCGCSFDTFVWPSWIINIGVDGCWGNWHINKLVVSSPTMIMYICGSAVDTIQVLSETPPFLGIADYNGFDFERPIVVVPCNSIPAYQAASGWSNFTHFIEDGMHNVTAQQMEHGNVTLVRPTCANPSATFTATADEGYHFAQWSDGDTNNPRIVPIVSDTTLTAVFAINQYTVNAIPNDLGMGTVTGSGMCDHGSTITLTATANSSYHFDHWSDNVTENPRPLTVTCDTTVTAYFVALPVDTLYFHDTIIITDTVTLTEYVPVHDTTVVTDTVTLTEYIPVHDTTVVTDTVTLTEYVPVHDTTIVTDTVTLTEYVPVHDTTVVTDTVMLTEYVPVHDTTYITITDTLMVTQYDTITNTIYDTIHNTIYDTTVVFNTDTLFLHDTIYVHDTIYIHDTIIVGVDEVDAINAKIYTSNGQIVVDGAENNTVWLYDVNGRILAIKQDEYSPLHFTVPASGTYLVKIGIHPARRVVVIR